MKFNNFLFINNNIYIYKYQKYIKDTAITGLYIYIYIQFGLKKYSIYLL